MKAEPTCSAETVGGTVLNDTLTASELEELKGKLRRPDLYYRVEGQIFDIRQLAAIMDMVWDNISDQRLTENQIEGYTVLTLNEEQIESLPFLIGELKTKAFALESEWERLRDDFIAASKTEVHS